MTGRSSGKHRVSRIRVASRSSIGPRGRQATARPKASNLIDRTEDDARVVARALAYSASMKRDELSSAGVLLRLQRRYGNRFVGRVVDRLRKGEQPGDSLASAQRSIGGDLRLDRQPAPAAPAKQSFDGGFIKLAPTAERFDAAGKGAGQVAVADPSQNVALGSVTNGDRGFVRFVVDMEWDFGNRGQGHPLSIIIPTKGRARLVTLTPFRVPAKLSKEDDKVKFEKTRPTLQFTEGKGASLDK